MALLSGKLKANGVGDALVLNGILVTIGNGRTTVTVEAAPTDSLEEIDQFAKSFLDDLDSTLPEA